MTPSDANDNPRLGDATEYGLSGTLYQRDEILGGRYRVISLLGRGGMGVVYRVEQIFLGKELALKTIDRQLMSDITMRRFQAEARAAFAVDHPNIVAVHDFGLFEDQTPFLVMEIVDGETLADRLKRGPLTVHEATDVFVQVCFGLAHAHQNGVVHRDIKPGNIMLVDTPEALGTGVKILDFGIAKLAHREGGEIQALTRTGEIFGSPLYMSPEQCLGAKVDHRADIYSLGCVIFESMTGKPPFIGENAIATMMLHQSAPIPTLNEACPLRNFPPELERLVALMLAKDPDERYQSLGDAAFELGALKRGDQSRLNPAIQPKRPARGQDRLGLITLHKTNFLAGMFGLALFTFLASGGITYFSQKPKIGSQTAETSAPETSPPEAPNQGAHQLESRKSANSPEVASSGSEAAVTAISTPNTSSANAATTPGAALTNNSGVASTSTSSDTPPTKSATADTENATRRSAPLNKADPDNEDSAIFDDDIKRGANNFQSRYASNASLKAFKNYKLAQRVSLQESSFKSSELENLKDSKLLILGLAKCSLDTFDVLATFKWLQVLDLDRTNADDRVIPTLLRLKMLRELNLGGCNISENGLRQLAKSNALESIYLSPNKYSNKFINELSDAMPVCAIQPYRTDSKLRKIVAQESSKGPEALYKKLISVTEKANKSSSAIGTFRIGLALDKVNHGQSQEARKLIDQTVALAESNGDLRLLSVALGSKANSVATMEKDAARALALNDRALQLFLDVTTHNGSKFFVMGIDNFTRIPMMFQKWDRAIDIVNVAVDFIDKFPLDDGKSMLPTFTERIGWLYYAKGKPDQALPYFKRTVDLTVADKGKEPKPYFRAIVEYAHGLKDDQRRKELYQEALEGLDKLGLPEDLNLNVHYCDACINMAGMFSKEGNHAQAAKYFRKALDALDRFKQAAYINVRKPILRKALVSELKMAGLKGEAQKAAEKYGVKP